MILNIMMSIIVGAAIFVGWNLVEYPLTNEEVIELYIANEPEISALWLEMGERAPDTTMRDAVEEWQRIQGE